MKELTTAAGAPVADNQNVQTAGPRGPMLLQDVWFLEKLAHFDREVIPERRVHAKGSGAFGTLKKKFHALPRSEQHAIKLKQGRAMYGVELRIVDAEGRVQPHDGIAMGELMVRGPWIARAYYDNETASREAFDSEGWLHTGDVVTIDADGYMQIVDRRKDVIKSGGEWISSIEIENAAVGHPDIAEAAVIGLPHPRWGERPLLVIVPKDGRSPESDAILAFLAQRLAKWQLPDDIVRVPEIPHTATGKILKTRLREMFREHRLPTA